jgi:hypothetical protein
MSKAMRCILVAPLFGASLFGLTACPTPSGTPTHQNAMPPEPPPPTHQNSIPPAQPN